MPSMVIKFGKHKDKTLEQIYYEDPDYLAYMRGVIKVEGKYAKQNQAMLDEIAKLLGPQTKFMALQSDNSVYEPPKTGLKAPSAQAAPFSISEKLLASIDSQLRNIAVLQGQILQAIKSRPNPLEPDQDVPF